MNKKEVIFELSLFGIEPKESLGQNFLVDHSITEKIVHVVKDIKIDTILEIGPGLGELTAELVKLKKRYCGVEKDALFAERLRKKFALESEIITGDILKIAHTVTKKIHESYAVVSNLPYNISTRVLRLFLADIDTKPDEMVMMLQKEVADKCVAQPGEMTKVSVLAQLYSEPKILFNVPPSSFYPEPNVDSAVIHLTRKTHPILCFPQDEKMFWQLVRIGFSSKRKKLSNNIAVGLNIKTEEVRNILKNIGLSDNCRAQELTIEQWVKIVDKMAKNY